jgi:hypothetical protein
MSPELPGAPSVVVSAPRVVVSATRVIVDAPSYSEIDASKFTLHILSDTPGGSQQPNYILLIYQIVEVVLVGLKFTRHFI